MSQIDPSLVSLANQSKAETSIGKVQHDLASQFSLLYYLRIVFYIIIFIKLVEIIFIRRRKLKISERIQRKFFFAHGIEMIKSFSAEEHELMNLTLQNTLKNAIQPLSGNVKRAPSKSKKTVSFLVESNMYYDPPEPKYLSMTEIGPSVQIKAEIDKKIQQQKLATISEQTQSVKKSDQQAICLIPDESESIYSQKL